MAFGQKCYKKYTAKHDTFTALQIIKSIKINKYHKVKIFNQIILNMYTLIKWREKKFDLMHGLNNNTNQVQKMPMFMKALKIYYTVCSQKTCTSVFNN